MCVYWINWFLGYIYIRERERGGEERKREKKKRIFGYTIQLAPHLRFESGELETDEE